MKALFTVVFMSVISLFAVGADNVCRNQNSFDARVDLANGDTRFEGPKQTVRYGYYVSSEGSDLDAVCKSLFGMKKHVQAAVKNVDFSGRIIVMSNGNIIFRDRNSYNYLTDSVLDWIVCTNRE